MQAVYLLPMLTIPWLLHAADPAPVAYPRSHLLAEARELAGAKPAIPVHVLDVRAKQKYLGGHIPGAVWVDHSTWSKAFAAGQDGKEWGRRIGDLGFNTDSRVVVYDDTSSKDAARIWWILRYWGVKDVRLLNGGWLAWQTAGGPIATGDMKPAAADARLAPEAGRLATKDQLLKELQDKPQLIDARSNDEFCGEAVTAKRNGTVPGAVHLEWSELLDPKTQRFKNADELAQVFRRAGIDVNRPSVSYCQSGGRSSVMIFALELMGAKDVRNYYRSWSEWGNAKDTPVEKPQREK